MKPFAARLVALTGALAFAGAAGPAAAAETGAVPPPPPPCGALALREVGSSGDDANPTIVFAVKNVGDASCRLIGNPAVRMLDDRGREIKLRFAPKTAMAMLLTLEPDAEASFTVAATSAPARTCAQAARIEVMLPAFAPDAPIVLGTTTTWPACSGAEVRLSNLRLGLPPPARPLTP